jgi:hypothetical protein
MLQAAAVNRPPQTLQARGLSLRDMQRQLVEQLYVPFRLQVQAGSQDPYHARAG